MTQWDWVKPCPYQNGWCLEAAACWVTRTSGKYGEPPRSRRRSLARECPYLRWEHPRGDDTPSPRSEQLPLGIVEESHESGNR